MQPVQKPRGMEAAEFSAVGKCLFALETSVARKRLLALKTRPTRNACLR